MRSRYSYLKNTRKINLAPLILAFIFLILFLFIIKRLFSKSTPQIISPLAEDFKADSPRTFLFQKKKPKDETQLLNQIREILDKQQGVYSVYIFDLTENRGYGINETTILTAASVNKVPVLAALYFEAQRGEIDLDRRITLQAKDIQDFGTGSLRYEGPGGVYSLKTLAQLMIEKSDNTAVFVLTNVIGEERIQELVDSWGMTQTDIKNNKTSNKDMALLFTKMYKEQIANQALTQEMIGFMDDSDFENRLPALLPKDVDVYHKIGNEIGNTHDVGIVDVSENPFYIGVLTNDVINEETTEVAIAQISKITYDFMTSK